MFLHEVYKGSDFVGMVHFRAPEQSGLLVPTEIARSIAMIARPHVGGLDLFNPLVKDYYSHIGHEYTQGIVKA